MKRFFKGSIPHVVVLDRDGNPRYNRAGEVDNSTIEKALSSQ
ncbi:MAG: hypothetical protein NVS9B15_14250 [Acidobacteriaceae bacterium]